MFLKNILNSIATIVLISNYITCQCQYKNTINAHEKENGNKNNDVQSSILTQNMEYPKNKKMDSNVFFADVLANTLREFIILSDINENCTKDGQYFVTEFNNQTLWAVQMYDSSSKYPRGILSGEVYELGDFDQCMRVSSEELGIHGAYALASIQFRPADMEVSEPRDFVEAELKRTRRDTLTAGPNSMLWAVCVPDSCTADDVKYSLDHALAPVFWTRNIVVDVTVPPLMYTSKDTAMKFSAGAALIWGLFVGSMILAVVGTIYGLAADRSKLEKSGFLDKCLYSYSIVNNGQNLLENYSIDDSRAIINGIKFFGIILVIVGHRIFIDLGTPVFNLEFFDRFYNSFWLGFLKTQVWLDLFFVISGFLTYMKISDYLKTGKPFKILHFLAYRFVRLFPAYIIVILIVTFILPYMGDGPLWKATIYPEAEFCRKNWWLNLLFINTYVKSYDMCLLHSWYLTCDMHFFIVGVFLTYLIFKWKFIGYSVFGVIFAMFVYMPAKYIYENKEWAVYPIIHSSMKSVRNTDNFHNMYIRSEFRITSYLIGMAAAYVSLRIKKSKFNFSLNGRFVGCAVCFLGIYMCMATTGYLYLPDLTYNPWHHVLYFTLQRMIYAFLISYLLVVGSTSKFGFISNMFENKFFTSMARLSYMLYLVQFIFQVHSVGQLRQPLYENTWIIVSKMSWDLITTLVISLVIYFFMEAPCRNILSHVINLVLNEHNNSDSNKKKLK